ncbi:MAG: glycosylase [Clostridium sp.]|jgi:maltose alpha-D-glucosyltransferase/alpha-amylase|nr:glycosylase [Clostridium sp.]
MGVKGPQWLSETVFYEIYPQSFYDTNGDGIGDLEGIIQKLDYVKGLGCNAIWINPCFDSPFMDAGYDVRDYKKIAPRYGTNADAGRLFAEAHQRDMRVILDLVPGHTSDTHEWFQKSRLHEKNEYSDRYIWTKDGWDRPSGFPYVCGKSQRSGCYLLNFFDSQPSLNYGFEKITADWQLPYTHPACQATFDAMLDVMRFWLDLGCDGFRVDMADSLVKNDNAKDATASFWRKARRLVDEEYPEAVLVSEWSNPPNAILKGGFHCDFYLNHPWNEGNGYYHLARNTDRKTGQQRSYFSKWGSIGGGSIARFLYEYGIWLEATKDRGYISFLTCNHDTPRIAASFDELEIKIFYSFLFTMPGVPFLYYGDEIGMTYQKDLVNVEGGLDRTGTRTPMQWNSGKNLGFSTAEPDALYLPVDAREHAPTVEAQLGKEGSLLEFTRELIALRRKYQDLGADGDFKVLYRENNGYPFVYGRGALICAVNPSLDELSAPVGAGRCLFSVRGARAQDGRIFMPYQSFAIFEKEEVSQ